MKKLLTLLLTLLLLPTIGSFNSVTVNGLTRNDYGYYPMGCALGKYEVSHIEDDGSLTMISCHDSFDSAKQEMKNKGDEYVVRSGYSPSPSKIVAMVSGRAYAYPGRSNKLLMEFYENQPNVKGSDAFTYTTENYELIYYDTTYMSSVSAWLGTGYIKVNINGFTGYCDSENVDLVPSKYIDKSIPIVLGGNNTYTGESPYKVTMKYSNYQLVDNGAYTDLAYTYYYAWPGSDGIAKSYTLYVDNGSAYSFMQKGVAYYSDNGYDFYSNPYLTSVSKVGTTYNYYMFMPLRSKTNIPASVFDSFLISVKGSGTDSVLKGQGSTFINAQNTYGMNALIIYAMACQEAAYGTSWYAVNRYNLFGWNATDANPENASQYSSVAACINQQMGKNIRGYMDITDSRYYGSYVGNKGNGFNVRYCSDPYWGLKIAAIAYKLDKYSCGNNGGLTDHNTLDVAVLNNSNTNVYKDNNGTVALYNPRNRHATFDFAYTTITYGYQGAYTKTASTNAIVNGNLQTEDVMTNYDFSTSIAYIKTNELTQIYGQNNSLTNTNIDPDYAGEAFTSLRDVSVDNNTLTLNGVGGITGYDFIYPDEIEHIVTFYDLNDDSKTYEFVADDIDSNGYNLNDSYDYTYTGFNLSVDMSQIPEGSYSIKLTTKIVETSVTAVLRNSNIEYRRIVTSDADYTYRVSTNSLYNYRIELDVISTPEELNYAAINKPSARDSLVTLESAEFDDNTLNVLGHAMIYYLNYTDAEAPDYDVYLVDDSDNYKKLDTHSYACAIPYKELLESSYELDNICFSASTTVDDLDGDYQLLVKIRNGEYVDICEFSNRANDVFGSIELESGTYNFYTSSVRYRVMLKATKALGVN